MIVTENFTVDELRTEDAADLSRLMVSDKKRFQRFFPITLGQNLTEKASQAYILLKQAEMKLKTEYTYAIREKKNRQVAGLIILKNIDREKKEGELAYCIGQKFAGKGWMTQTVRRFSQVAFGMGLNTLQIIVHQTNKASIRVAEKCGYIWQGTLKKKFTPPGEEALDMELYELKPSTP
jgi:ribosomal-protein-alanine N-acetyltransferase